MEIPVKNGQVKITEGARYLSELLYPHDERGHDKVLGRIKYWYPKRVFGSPHYRPDNLVDAALFFTWAYRQRGWQALNAVEVIQCYIHKLSSASIITSLEGTPIAFNVPATRDEAVQRLAACEKQLGACEKKLEKLKREATDAAAKSAECSSYGKTGGKPKKIPSKP